MKGWLNMRREKQTSVDKSNIGSIIGQHANFKGDLNFEGAVRIDGNFEGNIRSTNGGTLIVSEVANITGEVDVPNLVLHGTVNGNVRTSESLKMSASGRLNGDVEYRMLSLNEGASINGRCNRMDEGQPATAGSEARAQLTDDSEAGQPA